MADKVGSIYVDIGANVKDFEQKLKSATSRLNDFGKKANQIGRNISMKVTLPIIAAGAGAIKMASDYEESLNKVDVAFGKSSGFIQKFAEDSLRSFGIAEGSALDMAALFGDMATSMGISQEQAAGMSTSLVGLAGDLSSFKNIRLDVAETAMKSIFTGETESLKNLGIVMTQANLQAFAYSQGIQKNIQDMTEAEKVNLRYAYVLDKTTNAQGDFERTGGGAANQMRIFTESMKELGQTFGEVILPAFTKIITKVNGFIQRIGEMDETTKKLIITVAGIAAVIGPTILVIGQFSLGLSAITGVLAKLTTSLAATTLAVKALMLALKGGLILALAAGVIHMIELANGTRKSAKEIAQLKKDSEAAAKGLSNMNDELEKNKQVTEDSRETMDKWRNISKLTQGQISKFNHKGLKSIREELQQMVQSPFVDVFGGVDHVQRLLDSVNARISEITTKYQTSKIMEGVDEDLRKLSQEADALGMSMSEVASAKAGIFETAIRDMIDSGQTATDQYGYLVSRLQDLKTEMATMATMEAPLPPTMEAPLPQTTLGTRSLDVDFSAFEQGSTTMLDLLNPINQQIVALGEQFDILSEKAQIFGMTSEELAANQLNLVTTELNNLIESGQTGGEYFDFLTEKMRELKDEANTMPTAFENVKSVFEEMEGQMVNGFMRIGDAFGQSAQDGRKATMQVMKQLLTQAIGQYVLKALADPKIPLLASLALAAGGTAAVSAIFSGIPAFAEGGAVTSPTLAMIGEKPGSRGEAIIPFEKIPKLFDKMSGGANKMMVEVRGVLDGDVIRLVQDRAIQDNSLVR